MLSPVPIFISESTVSGCAQRDEWSSSCNYVRKVVGKRIKTKLNIPVVADALKAIEYMYEQNGISGLPEVENEFQTPGLRLIDFEIMNFAHLTDNDKTFIVGIFSSRDPLNELQTQRLSTLTNEILAAAVRGVKIVYRYSQNEGYGLGNGFRDLFDRASTVYVVDCK